MKYPSSTSRSRARAEILLCFPPPATPGRRGQGDPSAPNTSSRIVSKSISKNGGRARAIAGLLKIHKGGQEVQVQRGLLRPDPRPPQPQRHLSRTSNRRTGRHGRPRGQRLADRRRQLFYLCSRGLSEAEAATMIVSGFIEPLVKELPMEYAVEMNRLIELQMEGTVG